MGRRSYLFNLREQLSGSSFALYVHRRKLIYKSVFKIGSTCSPEKTAPSFIPQMVGNTFYDARSVLGIWDTSKNKTNIPALVCLLVRGRQEKNKYICKLLGILEGGRC